jgi:hypothetical protein
MRDQQRLSSEPVHNEPFASALIEASPDLPLKCSGDILIQDTRNPRLKAICAAKVACERRHYSNGEDPRLGWFIKPPTHDGQLVEVRRNKEPALDEPIKKRKRWDWDFLRPPRRVIK